MDIYRAETQLGPGTREIRVAVPALGTLRVAMPAEITQWVRVTGNTGGYSLPLDKDGKLAFTNLAPGEYTASANAGQMKVRVPNDGEVVFATQSYNGLSEGRLDEAGTMREAGLLVGDIVREANGVYLAGSSAGVNIALTRAVAGAEQGSLRVPRGGLWRTVVVPGSAWRAMTGHWLAAARLKN